MGGSSLLQVEGCFMLVFSFEFVCVVELRNAQIIPGRCFESGMQMHAVTFAIKTIAHSNTGFLVRSSLLFASSWADVTNSEICVGSRCLFADLLNGLRMKASRNETPGCILITEDPLLPFRNLREVSSRLNRNHGRKEKCPAGD
jgi:hypothetical protein